MTRFAKGWILRTVALAVTLLCAATGPAFAADEGWQFLNGPGGAFVRELERAPSDPDILYAATWGDLYKSTDEGLTWQALGIKDPVATVAVHPQNSSIVLAGTDLGEIARTVDGGATWAIQDPFPFISGVVRHVEIDPSAPNKAYALLATSSFSFGAPIVKSVDGGATWAEASDGLTIQEDPPIYQVVSALALHPDDPSILYTIDNFGQLFQSVDEGGSWERVPNIGLNQSSAAILAIDPFDSSFFLTGLFTGGVYRSEDAGIQWTESNDGLVAAFTQDFAFAPGDPAVVFGATLRGIFRSDNHAQSWSPVNTGIADRVMATVLVDPSDSQHLHAGGEVGVFETTDGGGQWIPRIEGFQHRFVSSLLVDRSTPSTVLAATRSHVFHRSTDAGQTWPLLPFEGLTSTIASLAAAPSDPSRLYFGSSSGRVFRSVDHGVTWTEVTPAGGISDTVASLAVHPLNPQIVYAGLSSGFGLVIARSSDGGDAWSASNGGLPFVPVQSVVIDHQDPSILFAGLRGGVYKSTDGGATWSQLAGGLPINSFARFEVFADLRTSAVYASAPFDGLFRSLDGGASWQAIHGGLPTLHVNTLLVDPDDPSVIYVAPRAEGIYRSPDQGETWSPFNDGFPDLGSAQINVNCLAIASSAPERRLYAGMFTPDVPSGIYGRSVPFPSLFTDGFESGDLSSWSPASAP